jgi:hypothetical protein
MLVRLDQPRGKTLAEDVVAASVECVEGASVLAVEIAHSGGEVRVRRLDEEVVVVAHQAAGVEAPAVPADHAPKLVQENAAVVVVQKTQVLVVAAGRDVVPRAGGEIATGACHTSTVALASFCRHRPDGLGTGSLQPRHVPVTGGDGRRPVVPRPARRIGAPLPRGAVSQSA